MSAVLGIAQGLAHEIPSIGAERPTRRLAAPPAPADRRAYVALLAVVVLPALLYPLVGASLNAALLLDILVRSALRVLRPHQEVRS